MSELRLIVGLGNPGKDYEYTRHNLGFLVVRRLAEEIKFAFSESSFTSAFIAQGTLESHPLCLLMPLTFMNESGTAVYQVMTKKGISPERMLIVCDDFHLDFQEIRLRTKGSDGGHNGLKSVIRHLGTDQFARLRMGVDRPPGKKDASRYVLEEFKKSERMHIDSFIQEAVYCCMTWLRDGIHKAMDQYNGKRML